jgi:hypothetical protein
MRISNLENRDPMVEDCLVQIEAGIKQYREDKWALVLLVDYIETELSEIEQRMNHHYDKKAELEHICNPVLTHKP